MVEFHTNDPMIKGTFVYLKCWFQKRFSFLFFKISDFRPIFLIGCLYKVLLKVLVNILKKVSGYVIWRERMTQVF